MDAEGLEDLEMQIEPEDAIAWQQERIRGSLGLRPTGRRTIFEIIARDGYMIYRVAVQSEGVIALDVRTPCIAYKRITPVRGEVTCPDCPSRVPGLCCKAAHGLKVVQGSFIRTQPACLAGRHRCDHGRLHRGKSLHPQIHAGSKINCAVCADCANDASQSQRVTREAALCAGS